MKRFPVLLFFLSCTFWLTAQKPFRLAILGCHKQFEPAPALVRYVAAEPDLCLWIGDNVYADTEDDITFIDSCYQALEAKPAFRQLRALPTLATWDDHDFGLNNAGKEYALKAESKALFRSFWGLESEIPADRDGIYYAKNLELGGKLVQFILLDVRYNRDAPQTDGDVLGEAQWSWLETQLSKPADLRLIASGFQILLDERAGSETWAKFPAARRRLFETVRKTRAEGVIFLTGDQHYGEVNRLDGAMDYDAIELQFAGINQIEDPEWNPLRVAPVIQSKHSYALLDIQLEETEREVPHLLFHIYDAMNDQRELTYRVNLSELTLNIGFNPITRFAGEHLITLSHPYPRLVLRYTLDGAVPAANDPVYTDPIRIDRTTTVKAVLFDRDGRPRSRVMEQTYTKLEPLPAMQPQSSKPGLRYAYFEGSFTQLDDLRKAAVVEEGVAQNFDPAATARREDHYGLIYEGYIDIPADGAYTFELYSDDGSRLYLHDQLVVDNDGSHSARLRSGLAVLQKGRHPLRLEYFEDYSGETLVLKMVDQSGDVRILEASDLFHQ